MSTSTSITTNSICLTGLTSGVLSTGGVLSTDGLTISPNYNWLYGTDTATYNPLKDLCYTVLFDIDNKTNVLAKNILSIRKRKFIFNCEFENNRIQPYEYIMSLIDKKIELNVTVEVSDIITITYSKFRFVEILNNLDFDGYCDFSKLHVKFKCEKISYENHKLSTKQLRNDKMKKIINNNESYNT